MVKYKYDKFLLEKAIGVILEVLLSLPTFDIKKLGSLLYNKSYKNVIIKDM